MVPATTPGVFFHGWLNDPLLPRPVASAKVVPEVSSALR